MTKLIKILFCYILLIIFPGNFFQKNHQQNKALSHAHKLVQLTVEEQAWLETHPLIRIAFDGDFPPYSFIDDTGQLAGIAYDTLQLISQKLNIEFETDDRIVWNDIYRAALDGKIDVIATMVNRSDREQLFSFTHPYVFKSLVVVTHKTNQQIKSRGDLAGKKVALVKDYQYAQGIINNLPDITPLYVENTRDALIAVETQQVDAAISFFAASYFIQNKYLLNQIKFAMFYDHHSANESIAVRKDWPILTRILQKGLNAISQEEKQAINNQWHPPTELPVDYETITKIVLIFFLICCVLLLWIGQIKRQNQRIRIAQNKLLTANSKLNKFKENLEIQVLQRTRQLQNSEQKYRSLVENLQDEYFFYQHNLQGEFIYISPSITSILGYSTNEFLQHYSTYQTNHPSNEKTDEYTHRCLKGEKVPAYEIEIFNKKGHKCWLEVLESPVYDDLGQCIGLEGIAHDITALKQTQKRLNWLSYYDDLTGLANRRLFTDRLEQMIIFSHRQQESMALLFLDLNRFKIVNDSLGHAVGDEVLKETALRLQAQLRQSDLAARIGGDEFTLLLPKTGAETAEIVAKKILQCFVAPYNLNNQQFFLGTSIGIAIYPQDGNDGKTLLQQADSAMYYAKKNNKGYTFCTTDLHQISNRRVDLEQALRHALRQNNYADNFELKIVYQPRYCVKTQSIQGYEALMRWQHPELGVISPVEFIPLAEETGLIIELSRWVITRVGIQTTHWAKEGFDFGKIAINISAVELINIDLAQNIIKQIDATKAQREWFEIEITESALMKAPDVAIKVMQELVDAGILIAIDDFGTGYSSLSYLKTFPVSYIKIDQSFIRNILNSPEDQTVVHAVIAMSHALGKQVIAEGVETLEQSQFLSENGCDIMQGYWFSMPKSANEITNHTS